MTENVVYGKEAMLHLHRMILSNNSVTWRLGFVEIRKKIVGQKWRDNYSHLMWFWQQPDFSNLFIYVLLLLSFLAYDSTEIL